MLEQTFTLHGQGDDGRKGMRGGAHWLFALPSWPSDVLWCGGDDTHPDDLAALRRLVGEVSVVDDPQAVTERRDLVVNCAPGASPLRLRELGRVVVDMAAHPSGDRGQGWTMLSAGDVLRGIAPDGDQCAQRRLRSLIDGERPAKPRPWRRRSGTELRRSGAAVHLGAGARDGRPSVRQPPAYVLEIGAAAGVDLQRHHWALWCRGDYLSQKLVMLLADHADPASDVVVKIARQPEANQRLVNEARGLMAAGAALGRGGDIPRVVFTGNHGPCFLCAQSMVPGRPYRAVLDAARRAGRVRSEDGVALLRSGVDRLERLAAATVHHVDAAQQQAALTRLVDWFVQSYRVGRVRRTLIEDLVLGPLLAADVPSVLQHGDPGVWNALVDGGSVRFVDWESTELDGLPLLDAVYFLRSAALALEPAFPRRNRLRAVRRHLVEGSSMTSEIAAGIERVRAACALPPALVEPLVHLTWLHRAVKHAGRRPDERGRSPYAELLWACLEGRRRPGFRSLVGDHVD
ncbi:MAG: phosphotransferase [Acidimicrobiia bacterium]